MATSPPRDRRNSNDVQSDFLEVQEMNENGLVTRGRVVHSDTVRIVLNNKDSSIHQFKETRGPFQRQTKMLSYRADQHRSSEAASAYWSWLAL